MGNSLSATLSADTMIGQCYVCSENIETQHDLLVHVRLHQSQLLSLIDLIDVSDSQSTIGNVGASRRQSGVITTQMSRDRSLECQVCKGKKFRRTNDLTRHYATHCRWTDLSLDRMTSNGKRNAARFAALLTHFTKFPRRTIASFRSLVSLHGAKGSDSSLRTSSQAEVEKTTIPAYRSGAVITLRYIFCPAMLLDSDRTRQSGIISWVGVKLTSLFLATKAHGYAL